MNESSGMYNTIDNVLQETSMTHGQTTDIYAEVDSTEISQEEYQDLRTIEEEYDDVKEQSQVFKRILQYRFFVLLNISMKQTIQYFIFAIHQLLYI